MQIVMKKSISFLLLMTLALSSGGQNFVQENQTWNVVECINFGSCITLSYKMTGDTTVGQVEYKKLYVSTDTAMINWSIFGGIREIDDRVFLYHFESMTEEILYDFNLLPGDTFATINHITGSCPVELQLTSIDTVYLQNGEIRQRFNFGNGGFNEEQWIVGVGSLNGFVNVGLYFCWFDYYVNLSCYHVDGELIYQSPSYNDCLVYTVGVEEKETAIKHSVYPNPFSRELVIEFDHNPLQSYSIQIINPYGHLVIDKKGIRSEKVFIYGDQLSSGIHFYRILKEGNVIATGKFVKK